MGHGPGALTALAGLPHRSLDHASSSLHCQGLCKPGPACYRGAMAARKKNPHAAALSKLGASKGGKARWEGVPAETRAEILRRAAWARWRKAKKTGSG